MGLECYSMGLSKASNTYDRFVIMNIYHFTYITRNINTKHKLLQKLLFFNIISIRKIEAFVNKF